ncbi:formyltransferase family protein [Agrobacterium tumefaciens]|uniref:formyltransferase family protein n=1 Tax=Agrobacterium tumefaciens TaxID=358 RepID=UPI00287E1357|nr:formyltransferase family protein [Agrobacterium tumefaciens]MDS7594764.1 formyltransferase family protein [Agrobacterium tumefaciens]
MAIAEFLIANFRNDLAAVVVNSDDTISRIADAAGLRVIHFESEEQIVSDLPTELDLGVLAWWPKIIKKPLLGVAKLGFINTHPSLLPFNRGKNYNFWALVENSPFGVTLHKVDDGVDTGDIIAQQAITYDWTDTGKTLYEKAQSAMVELFERTWPRIRGGKFLAVPQLDELATFHRASELEMASKIVLDQHYRADELLNVLRARTFHPHPGCWFEVDGQRYEISIEIKKVNP